MEMMHMHMMLDLDDLPHQPFPLSSQYLTEFSGGSSTNNHPAPPHPPAVYRYQPSSIMNSQLKQKPESMEAMREMVFRMAALQPVHIDPESIKPLKRRNVKISSDPQTVAARHRRERISERMKILQRLVPGGTKMDTASMLDEAAHYMKFLKKQVQSLEQAAAAGGSEKTSPAVNVAAGCWHTATGINHHGVCSYHSHLLRSCGQPAT